MSSRRKKIVKICATVLLLGGLASYGYYQSKRLIQGPLITVEEPANGSLVVGNKIELKGFAANIAFISLNDQPIFIEETGRLTQTLLLSTGYNIISLKARDKFGNEVEKRLELVSWGPTPELKLVKESEATSTAAVTGSETTAF